MLRCVDAMPEAPELYVLREWLEPRLVGVGITAVRVLRPLVLRNMLDVEPELALKGRRFEAVARDGKLLLFHFDREVSMVVSPMLAGELRIVDGNARATASTILGLGLDGDKELRYLDSRRMGQVYLLRRSELPKLARLERQGPDAIDAPLSYEALTDALRGFRGEVKSVLTGGRLVGGIGNAYADEILWSAGIFPFAKVSSLTEDQRRMLHDALASVPRAAVTRLRELLATEGIEPRKHRDILKVHGKAGSPCPTCETRISSVKARRRETNFCRTCQPGSLLTR